jgi:hypothetical protein
MAVVSDSLLKALSYVESSHRETATGDGGKAIGEYQIHKAYWKDATDFDKSIGGSYEDCQGDGAYSAKVVRAYMKRYLKSGASNEEIALTHNRDPNGKNEAGKNNPYWLKVKKALDNNS